MLRRGFLAGVLCPEGCRATLTVKRGHHLLARTIKRVRPGPIAKVRVKLTKRGRRVLREDHRRLRLTLRAALRLPSGTVPKRRATARAPVVRLDARELAAIFAGGFIGAIARAELAEALPARPGRSGRGRRSSSTSSARSLLGYFATRLQERLPLSAYRRPFLGTGFCGALTTFSTMQLELLRMLDGSHVGLAAGYAAASIVAGFLAVRGGDQPRAPGAAAA